MVVLSFSQEVQQEIRDTNLGAVCNYAGGGEIRKPSIFQTISRPWPHLTNPGGVMGEILYKYTLQPSIMESIMKFLFNILYSFSNILTREIYFMKLKVLSAILIHFAQFYNPNNCDTATPSRLLRKVSCSLFNLKQFIIWSAVCGGICRMYSKLDQHIKCSGRHKSLLDLVNCTVQ